MIHQPEAQFRQRVIGAAALPETARLYITLTLPGAEENVAPAALFDHAPRNIVVLVFIAVGRKLRAVIIPLKVSAHLVAAVLQIRIISQLVAAVVLDRPDTFYLCLDGVHDPDGVNVPDERRLPVDRGQNALECLVGRHLIAALFTADTQDRVGEQRIVPGHLKLHDIGMFRFSHLVHTSM